MDNTSEKAFIDSVGALRALNLLRYKAQIMADRSQNIIIDEDDVNEILIVAGMTPIIKPVEVKK